VDGRGKLDAEESPDLGQARGAQQLAGHGEEDVVLAVDVGPEQINQGVGDDGRFHDRMRAIQSRPELALEVAKLHVLVHKHAGRCVIPQQREERPLFVLVVLAHGGREEGVHLAHSLEVLDGIFTVFQPLGGPLEPIELAEGVVMLVLEPDEWIGL